MADGGISEGILDVAAELASFGLNPLDFIRTTNDIERSVLDQIRERMFEIRKREMSYLANEIAKALDGRV